MSKFEDEYNYKDLKRMTYHEIQRYFKMLTGYPPDEGTIKALQVCDENTYKFLMAILFKGE